MDSTEPSAVPYLRGAAHRQITAAENAMIEQEWELKRNCSLTPRQLGLAYALPCTVSFAISLLFALQGSWLVLAFAALEAVSASVAFIAYARHASDGELI